MDEFYKAVEMVQEKYGKEATYLQEDGDEYIIALNNCAIHVCREEKKLKVGYIPDVYTIDMNSQFYCEVENKPTVNDWTMCFEKLPSAFEKVRACDAAGNIEEGFIEKVGKHVICKTGDHFCLDYVVAWMPLTISN